MKTKIKFSLEDIKFELPNDCLRKTDWSGNPIEPYIYLRAKHVASIMKQYVKVKYPSVVCSTSSDTYSGGDSVRVNLSDNIGNPISEEIQKDVNRFSVHFEEGHFDGMSDMYEYSSESMVTDNGTKISGGTKYAFVENRPKFGTTPDIIRSLRELQAGGYVMGVMSLDKAIVEAKRWYKHDAVDKALKLI